MQSEYRPRTFKKKTQEFLKQSNLTLEGLKDLEGLTRQKRSSDRLKNKKEEEKSEENIQIPIKSQQRTAQTRKTFSQFQQVYDVPKSIQQFTSSYSMFYPSIFPESIKEETQWIEKNISSLYQLLLEVYKKNGIVDLISEGYKIQVFKQFVQPFQVKTEEQVFTIYKKYLFHYQNKIRNQSYKTTRDPSELFNAAKFVTELQFKQILEKNPLDTKYYDHDILLFLNGQNCLNIDSNYISLDKVSQTYKQHKIDIRIQRGLDYGFNVKRLRNEPYRMQISKYRKYQSICESEKTTELNNKQEIYQQLGQLKDLVVNEMSMGQRIKIGQIFFAVNFDPDDGLLVQHIQQSVKGTFLGYKEQFDILSFLDHQIPGCSLPQFYMKVKGVWTGGHQENVNMCAVNINHGPDSSQWYTMELEYVEKFRKALKEKFKIDLYTHQGLWYEKINWFVEQGFPIKKIVQKKGDVVISGPGTLHWVRSHGIALQSAWNIFPATLRGLKASYHRQHQNQLIQFQKSNVIPLKVLTLKLLNHKNTLLSRDIINLCRGKVKDWIDQEQKQYKQIISDRNNNVSSVVKKQSLKDLQGFCAICYQQILQYYFNTQNLQDIYCMNCYLKYPKVRKLKINMFKRYNISLLKKLLRLCQSDKEFEQFSQFCNGPYIGNIGDDVKCKWNQKDKKGLFYNDKDELKEVNEMNIKISEHNTQSIKKLKSQVISNKKKDHSNLTKQNQIDIQVEKQQKVQQQNQLIEQQKRQEPIIPQQSIHKQHRQHQYYKSNDGQWEQFIIDNARFNQQKCQKLLKHCYEQQTKIKNSKRVFFQYFVKKRIQNYIPNYQRQNNYNDNKYHSDNNNRNNNNDRHSDYRKAHQRHKYQGQNTRFNTKIEEETQNYKRPMSRSPVFSDQEGNSKEKKKQTEKTKIVQQKSQKLQAQQTITQKQGKRHSSSESSQDIRNSSKKRPHKKVHRSRSRQSNRRQSHQKKERYRQKHITNNTSQPTNYKERKDSKDSRYNDRDYKHKDRYSGDSKDRYNHRDNNYDQSRERQDTYRNQSYHKGYNYKGGYNSFENKSYRNNRGSYDNYSNRSNKNQYTRNQYYSYKNKNKDASQKEENKSQKSFDKDGHTGNNNSKTQKQYVSLQDKRHINHISENENKQASSDLKEAQYNPNPHQKRDHDGRNIKPKNTIEQQQQIDY